MFNQDYLHAGMPPTKSDYRVVINFNFKMIMSKKQQLPDAQKHQIISFVKSAIRIVGYGFLPYSLETATIILILSEIVGIVEELV